MKKRILCAALLFAMLLSGCSLMNGSYVSVTPHRESRQSSQPQIVSAENYLDLMEALTDMILSGVESATINLTHYPAAAVDSGMSVAIRYAMENDALGAYAVNSIEYEVGYSGGQPAVAVQISYLRNRMEMRAIQDLENMEQASAAIEQALQEHQPNVVMLIREYRAMDFSQFVQTLAANNPHMLMETPQVTTGIYGNGKQRVVELIFTYQNSRTALRQMQSQVTSIFDSAVLYVSEEASQWQKYAQLYGFLMERFDYTIETSITPAYSLLHHGVGDSKAFATVYAALCREIGLNCQVVTGTRYGMSWFWNIVEDNGYFYHVDLLRSKETGRYQEMTDYQMQGYVWDYSAYPACTGPTPDPQPSELPVPESNPDREPAEDAPSQQTAPSLQENYSQNH